MNLKKFILLTSKPWHNHLFKNLHKRAGEEWLHIKDRNEFNLQTLASFNPDFIFIPHWSYIIPPEIFKNYKCVVFHMADLPYGRGGSPLQNLIVRGHKETKISAIKVEDGIDTGAVYLKAPLSLSGTAREIFLRGTDVIERMIIEIIEKNPEPQDQKGETVRFKRRKPEDGSIIDLNTIEKVYDYIRMLDCEGYPPAFLETEHFRFEFTKASYNTDKSILANVRIIKK